MSHIRSKPGQRMEKVAEQLRQWVEATVGDNFSHTLSVDAGGGPAELLARALDAPVLFFGTGLWRTAGTTVTRVPTLRSW